MSAPRTATGQEFAAEWADAYPEFAARIAEIEVAATTEVVRRANEVGTEQEAIDFIDWCRYELPERPLAHGPTIVAVCDSCGVPVTLDDEGDWVHA